LLGFSAANGVVVGDEVESHVLPQLSTFVFSQ
jgi:hypothetical protein